MGAIAGLLAAALLLAAGPGHAKMVLEAGHVVQATTDQGRAAVAGIPVEQVLRATIPFLIPFVVSLVVITVFPGLSLWLPELVFGPRP